MPHLDDLIDTYLTDDDKQAIRQARGRSLAEQLYQLSLVVPTTPGENDHKAHQQAALVKQLEALHTD